MTPAPQPGLSRLRTVALMVAALLVPLGLATKWYHGPGESWVHDYAGDILFAAFWVCALKAARPALPRSRVGLVVFAACAAIEFTQLVHSPGLDRFRRTFLGHLLLGSGYEAADLAYYALGALIATALMLVMERGLLSRAS